jgi:hypothetical protein
MKQKSIIILFLLSLAAQYSQAILVRFPTLTGVVGDTLTVPLYVDDDLAGKGVMSFQFDIGYTSANVKFLGASTTGTISSGFNELTVKTNVDYSTIVGAGSTALSGKGILLNIKIVLLSSATSLVFRNTTTSNYFNEGNPVMTFTNGYITINAKPVISVSPTTAVLIIGETQQFNSYGGTAPYTWSVSDNTLATITTGGLLKVLKSGLVKVTAKDAKSYQGESGNIDCRSFMATFRDTTFYQNNYIEIPLDFKNLDATPMYAGKFVFSFTESVISFDSLIIANSILAGKASVEKSKQTGKVTVTFASSTAIINSGTIFKLRFKIADVASGASSITIYEATVNETLIPKWKNGYFTIKPLPAITVSPTSAEMYSGDKKQFTVSGGTAPYTWEVENATLATTTTSGYLTAVSGGVTKLLVKDTYGSKTSAVITIYDTWVNVRDSAAVVTQQSITIPIDLGTLPTGKGVISLSGKAMSSFAKIDSIKVSSLGTLTESWQLATKSGKNQTNFAFSGVTPITQAGIVANIKIYFNKTIVGGEAFYIDCNELMLNEGNPNVKVKSGYITIKSIISGMKEIQNDKVTVYPNPTTSYIQVKGVEGKANLSLYGIDGKLMLTKQFTDNETISVSTLPKGIYLAKICTKDGLIEKKLVKN